MPHLAKEEHMILLCQPRYDDLCSQSFSDLSYCGWKVPCAWNSRGPRRRSAILCARRLWICDTCRGHRSLVREHQIRAASLGISKFPVALVCMDSEPLGGNLVVRRRVEAPVWSGRRIPRGRETPLDGLCASQAHTLSPSLSHLNHRQFQAPREADMGQLTTKM